MYSVSIHLVVVGLWIKEANSVIAERRCTVVGTKNSISILIINYTQCKSVAHFDANSISGRIIDVSGDYYRYIGISRVSHVTAAIAGISH